MSFKFLNLINYYLLSSLVTGDDAASFTEGQEISGPVRIETEQSATFRVTFDITNDAESVDGTWSIGLNLANVAE